MKLKLMLLTVLGAICVGCGEDQKPTTVTVTIPEPAPAPAITTPSLVIGTTSATPALSRSNTIPIKEAKNLAVKECDPPTQSGDSGFAMNIGNVQYMCTPEGKWAVDESAMESIRKTEQHRRELYWALRSRVLTTEEMAEVEQRGMSLVVANGESYQEVEKNREFNDAILQQFRLRIAAEGKK